MSKISSSPGLSLRKPIQELELSARTKNIFLRRGSHTLRDILVLTDEQLFAIRNFGTKAFHEIQDLRQNWSLSAESTGETLSPELGDSDYPWEPEGLESPAMVSIEEIARAEGISEVPLNWAWLDLLRMGYAWETIEALEKALVSAQLPSLSPLSEHPLISGETVRYLLNIGCPLEQILSRRMTLSVSYRTLLRRLRLKTVLDVCLTDERALIPNDEDFPNFKADATWYVEWLGSRQEWADEVDAHQPTPVVNRRLRDESLTRIVDCLFLGSTERQRNIVSTRLGLLDGQEHTLEEVGDLYGLTRERVRQICAKALDRIGRVALREEIIAGFADFCRDAVDRTLVIRPTELGQMITESLGVRLDCHPRALAFILDSTGSAEYFAKWDLLISCKVPEKAVDVAIKSVRGQLTRAKAPVKLDTLMENMEPSVSMKVEVLKNRVYFAKCLECAPGIVYLGEDYWGLASWETKITDNIVMCLRRLGRAAHFTELTELLNEQAPVERRINTRSVHAKLEHHKDIFVRTGPGTFALREWNPNLPDQPPKFVDLIQQVLEKAGRPLTVRQIFQEVSREREARLSSIGMTVSMNPHFAKFGANKYGLAQWNIEGRSTDTESITEAKALPDEFVEQLKSKAFDLLVGSSSDQTDKESR